MAEGGVIGGVGDSGTVLVLLLLLLLLLLCEGGGLDALADYHVLLAARAGEEPFW